MRHLLGICACRRNGVTMRSDEGCALHIREGRGRRERWKVVGAHLRGRLEARRQLDQCGFTESRPEEADSERNAELRAVRWLRR